MSRFFWLIRREIWEHKAIWVAPLIVFACLLLLLLSRDIETDTTVTQLGIYTGLVLAVELVMGIIAFFYALDSLYADRRDRSVLFWKSLPLSDAETVLSKFAVATVLIPLVALAGAVLAQLLVTAAGAAKLGLVGIEWQPGVLTQGVAVAALWCGAAMLWYAPVVAYLMLASAWAPRGPFLWAVLPPVAVTVFERALLRTDFIGDFLGDRLFGLYQVLDTHREVGTVAGKEVAATSLRLSDLELSSRLMDFFQSRELWMGLVVAALLLAAAMWVRRYRDETT